MMRGDEVRRDKSFGRDRRRRNGVIVGAWEKGGLRVRMRGEASRVLGAMDRSVQ